MRRAFGKRLDKPFRTFLAPCCRGAAMGVPEHKKEIKTMSQEKIDRYKQEKANRKKNMKKQRMMGWARKGALTLAGLALVGWLGYSAYDKFSSNKSRDITTVNYEAVNSYLIDLTEE